MSSLEHSGDVLIVALLDSNGLRIAPARDHVLRAGDTLALIGDIDAVAAFESRYALGPLRVGLQVFAEALARSEAGISEVVVRPGAEIIGRRVRDVGPRQRYGISILAIYRSGVPIRDRLRDEVFHAGDMLVIYSRWQSLKRLNESKQFVVISDYPRDEGRPRRLAPALLLSGLALGLVIFTTLPLPLALMVGAVGMITTGVIHIDEAYQAVNWKTVFLLASLLPLGHAVEETGTAAWIAQQTLALLGNVPNWMLLLAVAGLATLFSLVMSNVGATVLLVPLAINMAVAVGADPRVFALTVALATSNAFLIPTHQVNALIMGPGGYSVRDFLRAGSPMTVLFLVVLIAALTALY